MEGTATSAAMSQEMIPLSEPVRWRAALHNLPHAFGHTWENCYAMQLTTGCPTYLYVWQSGEAKVVCPMAERIFRGFADVVTPYGFSGFVGTDPFPDFMDDWHRFAARAGYVCGYIGLNPLLSSRMDPALTKASASNRLYVMDLQLSVQTLYQKLARNRRTQLKGFENRKRLYSFEKSWLREFFISRYPAFVGQKKAASAYNFSFSTLSYLLDLEQVVLTGYAEEGDVKAVAVFAYTECMGEYLFSVSLPGYENQAAPLLWYGALQLKEKHVPYLNLGGGVTPGDSIAWFKQRFGALDLPLTCLKQVYQEELYSTLCQQAGVARPDEEGYFPAYRRVNEARQDADNRLCQR